MSKQDDIAILILAAGESKRMGRPKQLLPWGESTLLENAISTAVSTNLKNIHVVLGAHYELIKESINLENVVLLYNLNYKSGQGSSLSLGIDHLSKQKEKYQGVLILLCDQPLITSDYLNELIQTFEVGNKKIVATDYGNRAGVPAIFAANYFNALLNIKEDMGAKKVLEKYMEDVISLSPNGTEQDLDTPEEYKTFVKKFPRKK